VAFEQTNEVSCRLSQTNFAEYYMSTDVVAGAGVEYRLGELANLGLE
jgi:hypothetical protein